MNTDFSGCTPAEVEATINLVVITCHNCISDILSCSETKDIRCKLQTKWHNKTTVYSPHQKSQDPRFSFLKHHLKKKRNILVLGTTHEEHNFTMQCCMFWVTCIVLISAQCLRVSTAVKAYLFRVSCFHLVAWKLILSVFMLFKTCWSSQCQTTVINCPF